MSKSEIEFERWVSIRDNSWPFQVFKKHTQELNMMMWANEPASKFVYQNLKNSGAIWDDKASKYFNFPVQNGREVYENLKDWSNSYNQFQNWTNLNGLMAITSNFETYLAAIVSLALESDPGVLFKSSKSIDGAFLLKHGGEKFPFEQEILTSFTKGDWNSRKNAFHVYFDFVPTVISNNIGELEKIRNLRNKIGHAFGRDIDESRNTEVKDILPMESLSNTKFIKIRKLIWQCVNDIDDYLLNNHIGEYQVVRFYHSIAHQLSGTLGIKTMALKKKIGTFGDLSGKKYCKGLIEYYDKL